MKLTALRPRALYHAAFAGMAALFFTAVSPTTTQNAIANGDTRTIYLHHSHTGEDIAATFRVDGQYDPAVLKKLNWFLRDWRNDATTSMDPRLFDVIWETYRESGSRQPIQVVSAYRSPVTNAMLRRRSRAVAEHSQHILGKAMDMHYVDVPMSKVREIAMKLQRGGVGYYPTAGTPFVHLDVGSVRAWPRMSYDQLVRLFPDGKTVHLPPSGHPLARYEEAREEIDARNAGRRIMVASAQTPGRTRGFFERLFGVGADDEDTGAIAPPRGRTRIARVTTADKDDAGEIQTGAERRAADKLMRAARNLPKRETVIGAPAPVQVAAVAFSAEPVPTPPRRPAELGAVAVLAPAQPHIADAPLPPVRPSALVAVASAQKAPAPLPDVIRHGAGNESVEVMAYAAQPATVIMDAPPLRGSTAMRAIEPKRTRLYAARLDRTNFALLTQATALGQSYEQKDLGMRPGLRAAVKAEGRALALSGAPLAPEAVVAMFADLRADRFTASAMRPVRTADLVTPAEGRQGPESVVR